MSGAKGARQQTGESEITVKCAAGYDAGCAFARPLLSRYLDNDLPARDATSVVAHLSACGDCRTIADNLSSVREGVRALAAPLGGEAARDRVFVRLERVARLAEAERVREAEVRRQRFPWHSVLSPRPVFAATAGVAALIVAGGALVWKPAQNALGPRQTASAPAAPVALPAPDQMSALFQMHDARVEAVAQATSADDVATPPDAASGGGGGSVTPSSSSTPDNSSGSAVSSDEVPEAL